MKTQKTYFVESFNEENGTVTIVCDFNDGTAMNFICNCYPGEIDEGTMTSEDFQWFIRTNGLDHGPLYASCFKCELEGELGTELSDAAYFAVLDQYSKKDLSLDMIRKDVENDYVTANEYRGRTYVHYQDNCDTWLIDVETGKVIDDDDYIDVLTGESEGKFYITMCQGTRISHNVVLTIADVDNGGYCDCDINDFICSYDEVAERVKELREYTKDWQDTRFTVWNEDTDTPIDL